MYPSFIPEELSGHAVFLKRSKSRQTMSTSLHPALSITSHVNRFQNPSDLEERGARDSASPGCGTVSQGKKSSAMPILGRAPTTAEQVDVLRGLRVRHYRSQGAILESCILALPYPEASVSLRQARESCSVEKALGRHLRICQGLSQLSRLICPNQIRSIMLRNSSMFH